MFIAFSERIYTPKVIPQCEMTLREVNKKE